MNYTLSGFFLWFLLSGLSAGCTDTNADSRLRIATAANMQYAMAEIQKAFEAESGIHCDLITGSSGKLTAQITGGAPYDIFVSADMKYPEKLAAENLTLSPPRIYAYGHLILWSLKKDSLIIPGSLLDENIAHIAVANPQTAPYGLAAMEVLENLGLRNQLESRLVFGESIAQVNQFVTSGAAGIGFTAKSVVFAPGQVGKGNWAEIDQDLYTPIAQGAVIMKGEDDKILSAQRFFDFLFSEKGKQILNNFGYSTTE